MTKIAEAKVGPSLKVCEITEFMSQKFRKSFDTSVSALTSMPGNILGDFMSGTICTRRKEQRLCYSPILQLGSGFSLGFV